MRNHFGLLAIVATLIFISGVVVGLEQPGSDRSYYSEALQAISDCERSLPRDKFCEAVITARVKK